MSCPARSAACESSRAKRRSSPSAAASRPARMAPAMAARRAAGNSSSIATSSLTTSQTGPSSCLSFVAVPTKLANRFSAVWKSRPLGDGAVLLQGQHHRQHQRGRNDLGRARIEEPAQIPARLERQAASQACRCRREQQRRRRRRIRAGRRVIAAGHRPPVEHRSAVALHRVLRRRAVAAALCVLPCAQRLEGLEGRPEAQEPLRIHLGLARLQQPQVSAPNVLERSAGQDAKLFESALRFHDALVWTPPILTEPRGRRARVVGESARH